jgi:hypothetical protein
LSPRKGANTHVHRDKGVWIEAEIDRPHPGERTCEQARAGKQDYCDGDLADEEEAPYTACRLRGRTTGLSKVFGRTSGRLAKRRQQASTQAGQQGHKGCRAENAQVNGHTINSRNGRRRVLEESRNAAERQSNAQRGTSEREESGFHKRCANDSQTAGAQDHANANLARGIQRPDEQNRGSVEYRQHEQQAGCEKEHCQRTTGSPDGVGMKRIHADAGIAVTPTVTQGDDSAGFLPCGCKGDPWRQPA